MFIVQSTPIASTIATRGDSPIFALIGVVVESILEVFFLCLVGWILAHKGIVDDKAKKILNKLNVSLFTPALLFSKVAFSLSPDKLADLIIIPIGFCLVTAFSALVSFGMGYAFRLKKGQRNFAVACAMFQNSNSLPIALMQSLIGEHMPFGWGPHDSKDQQLGRALSYLVLFSTLGIIVRWSIGVRLLTSAETEQDDDEDALSDAEAGDDDRTPLLEHSRVPRRRHTEPTGLMGGNGIENGIEGDGARAFSRKPSEVSFARQSNGDDEDDEEDDEEDLRLSRSSTSASLKPNGPALLVREVDPDEEALAAKKDQRRKKRGRIFQSFPNTPIPSQYGGSEAGTISDDEDDLEGEDAAWGARRGAGRNGLDSDKWGGEWVDKARYYGGKVWRPVKRIGKKIGAFMTVPLWAALLSLFVACVPPLQSALNQAEPLKAAIRNAGNCSVPITLVTLGAYFYRPSSPSPPPSAARLALPWYKRWFTNHHVVKSRDPRNKSKLGETRTILVAVISRMIVVPLILIPCLGWYAAKTVNVADDPVFVVTACLLIGSPTAITLAQITSSASGDTFEKLISKTLFVSYAIMTAPCTIILVLAALYIDKKQ